LIASFRKRDKYHRRALDFLVNNKASLITTLPVITEVCHFLNAKGKVALLQWIRRGGLLLQPVSIDEIEEIESIIAKYGDRDIDFCDATLVWLASKRAVVDILTVDRKDLDVYRLPNGKRFNLVAW
jgi:uncharacterized protein